jgi:RimJ/RimL family protein N-acetyltransferase
VRVQVLDDVHAFAALAAPALARDPVGTTIVASAMERALALPSSEPSWWFVVVGDDGPVGLAMHDFPWPPYLAPMPAEAAVAVADALSDVAGEVPGINGEERAVLTALARWQQQHPSTQVASTRGVRLYRLDRLVVPAVPGVARPASSDDVDLIVSWSYAFAQQTDTPAHDIDRLVRHRLATPDGGYVVWTVDGEPVSLAGFKPPSHGVARIGPVFTPAENRGHGYGSAVTAAASSRLTDSGADEVVLFTDLGNPTSNKIYTAIGYAPVRDFVEVRFAQPRHA